MATVEQVIAAARERCAEIVGVDAILFTVEVRIISTSGNAPMHYQCDASYPLFDKSWSAPTLDQLLEAVRNEC